MSVTVLVLWLLTGADAAAEEHATRHAKLLLTAGEAYAIHPANREGRYPVTVADLNQPPFAKGTSFLKKKEKDLTDP
jgi:hypothetical protein